MQAIEGNNKSIFSGITSDYNIQVKLYISNLSILENFFNILYSWMLTLTTISF